MKLTRQHWTIIWFNIIYVLAFGIYYTFIKDYEFLLYLSVIVILLAILLKTLDRSKLDNLALWLLSIWGLLHMVGGGVKINGTTVYAMRLIPIFQGAVSELYVLKMDQVIHFYGFFVAAFVLYQGLSTMIKNKKSKAGIFYAWAGSMGLGALNEVIEFIALLSITYTGVGGVYNMGLDLMFNCAGALVGSLFGYYWINRKK